MNETESRRLLHLQYDNRQSAVAVRDVYGSECSKCGACCIYYSQGPFGVPVALSDTPPKKLVQIGPRLKYDGEAYKEWNTNSYMRSVPLAASMFFGREGFKKCVALNGELGQSVRCVIYESRPRPCVEFDPGSRACIRARAWAGMPSAEGIMDLGRS